MARRWTSLALLALATLPACGLFLPREDKWPIGSPPPESPSWAATVEGDVRSLRTVRPIVGAELVLTTGRKGYERRARTDGAGRFQIGYSTRAREEDPYGDSLSTLLTGLEPSENVTYEVTLRVSCRGWKPIIFKAPLDKNPLFLSMEPAEGVDEPSFDCGE
jgi:hypothetical protein